MRIIAYPEYHDPEDFLAIHLPEIIDRHFDTILFPVCEQSWQSNLNNIRIMREMAEDKGLDTWVGPWGLGGVFSGEALSTYNSESEAALFFELWKQDMITSGFRTIFLDEPCVSGSADETALWYGQQRLLTSSEIRLVTTMSDDLFTHMSDEQVRRLPVDSVGVSCYHWTPNPMLIINRTLSWTERLTRLRPRDHHVWVQNFDLPRGTLWIPELTEQIARTVGVRSFGYWAFRGTRGVAVKTCAEWEQVWDQHLEPYHSITA